MLLKHRSQQKELLDGDDIPFEDIKQNMHELNIINSRLGGHKITLTGFKKLLKNVPQKQEVHVLEIGCGGGDNLSVIKKYAVQNNIKIKLTGVDIKQECVQYAQQQNEDIEFICSDYKLLSFQQKPHIIFSSLFCHHFTNEELVQMLKWMNENASVGFFINDLHRHPLAFYSIEFITQTFSKSYLVKNDAPISVARGFKRKEWERLLQKTNIINFSIYWKWAFRWLIICRNN